MQLALKKTAENSCDRFEIAGWKYKIYWTKKKISMGNSNPSELSTFDSETLYEIYQILLERGFESHAKELKAIIEANFPRVAFYLYTNSKNKHLPIDRINSFISLLKRKKVNFIHTVQDYNNRPKHEVMSGNIRCVIHFKRIELIKILGLEKFSKLNLHCESEIEELQISKGITVSNMNEDFIYWSETVNTLYKEGKQLETRKVDDWEREYGHELVDSDESFPDIQKERPRYVKRRRLGWNVMEDAYVRLPENFPSDILTVAQWKFPKKGDLCINSEGELDIIKSKFFRKADAHFKGSDMYTFEISKSVVSEGMARLVLVLKEKTFKFNGKIFTYKPEK